mmetsp:Transcript_6008/g.25433  ORF Transcript_6008/g.25433 Transcript_6008/m.25433 type:complete len:241 (-) Transcript_6008:2409-3131(-)
MSRSEDILRRSFVHWFWYNLRTTLRITFTRSIDLTFSVPRSRCASPLAGLFGYLGLRKRSRRLPYTVKNKLDRGRWLMRGFRKHSHQVLQRSTESEIIIIPFATSPRVATISISRLCVFARSPGIPPLVRVCPSGTLGHSGSAFDSIHLLMRHRDQIHDCRPSNQAQNLVPGGLPIRKSCRPSFLYGFNRLSVSKSEFKLHSFVPYSSRVNTLWQLGKYSLNQKLDGTLLAQIPQEINVR